MEFQFISAGIKKSSKNILPVINPYNGKEFANTYIAGENDIEESIVKLKEEFSKTRALSSMEKAAILLKVVKKLEDEKEDFARLISQEAAKPIKSSRIEVDRAIAAFTASAEEAKRIGGEVLPIDTAPHGIGKMAITKRFPVGLVLGITPFNFPLMLVAHKVAPAIASGNPIIIKPASKTPLSALKLGYAVIEAGWSAISVLPCAAQLAEKLACDERIKLLTFTGSDVVGWALKEKAGKKKVALELGGNAAVIVHKDADVKLAAGKCAAGGFSFAGQTCISVQRIYAHSDIYEEFKKEIVKHAEKLKAGDPLNETSDLSCVIDSANADRLYSWIKEAENMGGVILTGGKKDGAVIMPTVMENVPDNCCVVAKEVFGPLVVLEKYNDFENVLQKVNKSRFGLQAGLFTNDINLILKAYDRIEVGGLMINEASAFRVDSMPYGGVKDSGTGREGPRYAIEEMTELKILII